MELYKEILIKVLERHTANVEFPTLEIDAEKIVEQECYQALLKIKEIIENESLNDAECFEKIEEIIQTLEFVGSNGGNRHD
ncbi:MAG: hypothetical protein IJ995_04175 [Clostridia bacterium]|nr:hypothetical protein [Clostridia bacterium]